MTAPLHGLHDLVAARRVAVIGASSDPARIGGRPVAFLLSSGFAGTIYPVNAKYTEVQGLRCYPDLGSIPDAVDAAIVSVPARDVPGVIDECGRKGVKAAVVFSSGFSEVGDEGRAVQGAIAAAARRTGVRVIGPNCQGLVAVHQRLNLSFSSAFGEWGEPGTVAVISQSGGIGGMLAMLLRDQGVGFSYWISSGNEADIDVAECIEFFADDVHTRVVAGYVENIRDGARLLDAVARCRAAGKPVVLLRAGRSPQAARAAASHTGAVAAENRVAEALLAEAGVTQARDPQELLDAVYGFARAPAPAGNRVAILSNSGGLGVIMSDTCASLGLVLPELSPSVQGALRAFLPAFGASGNPVDVTAQILADFSLLPRSLEVLLQSPDIDIVVVALGMANRMYPVERIARDIVRVSGEARKPVMVAWVAGAPEGEVALRAAGLPVFTDSTRCLKTIAALVAWTRADAASRTPARVSTPSPPDGVERDRGRGGDGSSRVAARAARRAREQDGATRPWHPDGRGAPRDDGRRGGGRRGRAGLSRGGEDLCLPPSRTSRSTGSSRSVSPTRRACAPGSSASCVARASASPPRGRAACSCSAW